MRRVAFILGSPFSSESEAHLRGVYEDVDNYKAFLMSSDGGAWHEDEIHIRYNIKKASIGEIHDLCHDSDIAYVIYSGHGFMERGENYININEKESLNVSGLYTSAKRQITIIDACRVDHQIEHFAGISGLRGIRFDNTRPDIARHLYDHYINNSSWGNYTMFSCSENEYSKDTEDGGSFTVSLLRNIKRWSLNTDKFCLTAYDAINYSYVELKQRVCGQTPAHEYSENTAMYFPFSISTRAYLKSKGIEPREYKSLQRRPYPAKQNTDYSAGIFALGLVGLVLLSSSKKKS